MNNANEKNVKTNNKPVAKVIAIVLAFALMIATSFVVSTIVHNHNLAQSVSKVKNGLSAYELAVENGYNGSVQEWLTSLDGKSAYDIAVENGYSGSEKDWAKSLKLNSKQEQSDIKTAYFDEKGELIIKLSDGTSIDVGAVAGTDGKNGTNGKNGKDGKNGKNGKDGKNGIDGKDGINGVDGSNGSSGSNGKDGVNGTNGVDGKDGKDGINGTDGVGISQANVNSDGELVLTFTDGRVVNLDKVVGAKGEKGDRGEQGLKGEKGDRGEQGLKGDKGDRGEQGLKGDKGDRGEQGLKGEKGDKGDRGEQGLKGEKGDRGEQGLKGDKGDKGTDGINGTNGVDGKDGVDGTDGINGADGVGIENVTVASYGVLTVTLTNGTVLNLGNIKGADGIGITKSEINASGELVLTYSDGATANLGKVKGEDGQDGADGRGIQSVSISTDGELIVTYTDSSVVNLGNIKGEKGDKGDRGEKGEKGEAGRGILKTEVISGELWITYTDAPSTPINVGSVSGNISSADVLQFQLLSDNTYGVKASVPAAVSSSIVELNIPDTYNGKQVTQILDNAFDDLYFLKKVTIPFSINKIGADAFTNCSVSYVMFTGSLQNWCEIDFANLGASPCCNSAILFLEGDTKVEQLSANIFTTNSVTSIPAYAFAGCNSVKEVAIPDGVTTIGAYAFYNSSIENVTLSLAWRENFAYKDYDQKTSYYFWGTKPAEALREEVWVPFTKTYSPAGGYVYDTQYKRMKFYDKTLIKQ